MRKDLWECTDAWTGTRALYVHGQNVCVCMCKLVRAKVCTSVCGRMRVDTRALCLRVHALYPCASGCGGVPVGTGVEEVAVTTRLIFPDLLNVGATRFFVGFNLPTRLNFVLEDDDPPRTVSARQTRNFVRRRESLPSSTN